MSPLDGWLRRHVAPVFEAAGFAKSGRMYWTRSARGDYASFSFEPWSDGFRARYRIAPRPMTGWALRITDPVAIPEDPREVADLWTDRLFVPGLDMQCPYVADRWDIPPDDAEAADRFGQQFAEVLVTRGIPKARRLLDRATLLELTRLPPAEHGTGLMQTGARYAPLVLLVDEEPGEELEHGLVAIESEGDPIGFAAAKSA